MRLERPRWALNQHFPTPPAVLPPLLHVCVEATDGHAQGPVRSVPRVAPPGRRPFPAGARLNICPEAKSCRVATRREGRRNPLRRSGPESGASQDVSRCGRSFSRSTFVRVTP